MKLCTKIIFIFFLFSLIFLPKNIEARSGCCSHHGGICGCGCCDGTGLSATCAPYYPECSGARTIQIIQPTNTPRPTLVPTKRPTAVPTKIPTIIPTNTPTITPTITPTLTPTIEPIKKEEFSPTSTPQPQVLGETNTKPTEPATAKDFIIFFSILGLLGFGIYKLFIKIKNKIKKLISKYKE